MECIGGADRASDRPGIDQGTAKELGEAFSRVRWSPRVAGRTR